MRSMAYRAGTQRRLGGCGVWRSPCIRARSSETLGLPSFMVCHYLVKGRVQGVGFRWFVHREAAALELNGWVRNTEDGHVEVLAAGDAEPLGELKQALRRGSRGSRVDAVIEHELDAKEAEGLGPFRIE